MGSVADGCLEEWAVQGSLLRVLVSHAQTLRLRPGDIFHAQNGDEHVAHPDGPVRALVIEKSGCV
ncbi:hypothetical protein [Falsiruegeria litorea]|uniref:hypothetical protein n=1 Tax=Falsiruegeria litorea TaxID=1280831 RepID=UPI001A9863C2|nr:hypothetical protein [Falsiruegeria litorea]